MNTLTSVCFSAYEFHSSLIKKECVTSVHSPTFTAAPRVLLCFPAQCSEVLVSALYCLRTGKSMNPEYKNIFSLVDSICLFSVPLSFNVT